MDEYTRAELKELGVMLFALVVIPCILAAVILLLLWWWIPAAIILVAIILVGAFTESVLYWAGVNRRNAR